MRARIMDRNIQNKDSQILSFVQMLADNFEQNHEMNQFDLDSLISDTYKRGRVGSCYDYLLFEKDSFDLLIVCFKLSLYFLLYDL